MVGTVRERGVGKALDEQQRRGTQHISMQSHMFDAFAPKPFFRYLSMYHGQVVLFNRDGEPCTDVAKFNPWHRNVTCGICSGGKLRLNINFASICRMSDNASAEQVSTEV